MSTLRYLIETKKGSATVEFAPGGDKAVVRAGNQTREVPSDRVGAAFWEALAASGTAPITINGVGIHEGDTNGKLVASLHPVMEGARVIWLILYRADKDASAFKPLGNRQRMSDALDAAFVSLAKEIRLPHKP